MKHIDKIMLLSIMLVILGTSCATGSAHLKTMDVSEIIANRNALDGKLVRVQGDAVQSKGYTKAIRLYQDSVAVQRNSFFLDITVPKQSPDIDFNFDCAVVEGTFANYDDKTILLDNLGSKTGRIEHAKISRCG